MSFEQARLFMHIENNSDSVFNYAKRWPWLAAVAKTMRGRVQRCQKRSSGFPVSLDNQQMQQYWCSLPAVLAWHIATVFEDSCARNFFHCTAKQQSLKQAPPHFSKCVKKLWLLHSSKPPDFRILNLLRLSGTLKHTPPHSFARLVGANKASSCGQHCAVAACSSTGAVLPQLEVCESELPCLAIFGIPPLNSSAWLCMLLGLLVHCLHSLVLHF